MNGLSVAFRDDPAALLAFAFGAKQQRVPSARAPSPFALSLQGRGERSVSSAAPTTSLPTRIDCARLAGPAAAEGWFVAEAIESVEHADVAWRRGRDFAAIALRVEEIGGDVEAAAAEAYRRLLTAVRPSAHPYLLRIWNYLPAINRGEGDIERYRRFCVGRARAVDAMFGKPPPAATAIGTDGRIQAVQVIALCGRAPGIALENPRQTPAWQYPREYGPVPPGFSRGALVGAGDGLRLLASGTASIVGHVSQHPGDVAAQLRESLTNLEVLLAEGEQATGGRFGLGRHEALRVYLRRAEDLPAAQAGLRAALGDDTRVLYLRGDICRRELLVELEGVFAPAA